MATILQPKQGFGEMFGAGLGQGIQSGVGSLIEQKLQAMQQERQYAQREKGIEALVKGGFLGENLSPEAMQGLKYAPDSVLNSIIKNKMTAPQAQAYQQAATRLAQDVPYEKVLQEFPGLKGQEITQLGQTYAALQQAKRGEEKIGRQESSKYRETLSLRERDADIMGAELGKLENLIKEQDVASGIWGTLPTPLQNEATQEAQTIINKMVIPLEAKARANSDKRLDAVVKSLVSLSQTKGAQLKTIDYWKDLVKLDKIEAEVADEIIEERKGIVPGNLEKLAYKRSAPEREKILSKIEKGIGSTSTAVAGKKVSSVKPQDRPIGAPMINPKTGERYIWNGTEAVLQKG